MSSQGSRLSDIPSSIIDGDRIPAHETFDFSDLEDITDSLSDDEFTGEPSPILLTLPTFEAYHTYRNNTQLSERRLEALRIGAGYLNKYFLHNTPKVFSRRLLKDVFGDVSARLDELLSSCVRVPIEGGFGFTIRRDYYTKMQSGLLKIKAKLGEILLVNGVSVPDLPFWGLKGDLDEFYLPNDFEILGICYRTEVERFLFIFDEHYYFQTDLPRNPDLQPPVPSPEPPPLPTPPPVVNRQQRDPPPHRQGLPNSQDRTPTPNPSNNASQTGGNGNRRTPEHATGWFMQDPVSSRRRQSNIYHFEDGTARASQAQRNSRANARPPTAKIREVLNNIGENFDDFGGHTPGNERSPSSASRANHGRQPGPPGPPGDDPSDGEDNGGDPRDQRNPQRPPGIPQHPRQPYHQSQRHRNGGGPPDDDPDGGNGNGGNGHGGGTPRRPVEGGERRDGQRGTEPHFDFKLKFENVPKWDGDTNTIVRWLSKVNNLARMSNTVFTQLGTVVPRRFEGSAETWYWSLPSDYRSTIERNWDTLRSCISSYYMNRKWLDKQKARAIRAYYREPGHTRETPSDYYIRKAELLNTVYTMDDSEIILETMEGAPASWNTILTTQLYLDVIEFQAAIRFHEDTLMRLDSSIANNYRRERFEPFSREPQPFRDSRNQFTPRVNLVGLSKTFEPPNFPKDDSNISKRSATPEDKGARPCRHCGSGKHWDNECKYAFKGNRSARVNRIAISAEDQQAQQEYDDLYYELDSAEEDHSFQQDFRGPPQISDQSTRDASHLGGGKADPFEPVSNTDILNSSKVLLSTAQDNLNTTNAEITEAKIYNTRTDFTDNRTSTGILPSKPPLNRRTRRRLARDISTMALHTQTLASSKPGELVELKKLMARPPGCAFLGSKATQTTVAVGQPGTDPMKIIVDSGSDITLISQATLDSLSCKPATKGGQKIELIQVTGRSSISGFVDLDLFFQPKEGPVKIGVEAYVVKGMSTPFILGNDFSSQYSISVLREDMRTYIKLGDSGRTVEAEDALSSPVDEEGHAFRVKIRHDSSSKIPRNRAHRKNQKFKRKLKGGQQRSEVRATRRIVIPPEVSKSIPVKAFFPKDSHTLFVERKIDIAGNPDNVFGSADSLISRSHPFIHVANFSSSPVVISEGQLMGTSRNPHSWLDRRRNLSKSQEQRIDSHSRLIRSLAEIRFGNDPDRNESRTGTVTSHSEVSSKAQRNATEADDPAAQDPLEGGPKTSETAPDPTPAGQLLNEVNISEDLSNFQRSQLERIILKNQEAFGLDGRLGNYKEHIDIPMKPGAVPVSLPPFPVSPAKREVIDKQMDSWIKLGVIEPSKSPWAAPVFIVYRNGKPRMVIDLRKLNESVVPDEFPIPKQEDILQALTGSQWLTTLDALAGFT
jgi:hypothetical protein